MYSRDIHVIKLLIKRSRSTAWYDLAHTLEIYPSPRSIEVSYITGVVQGTSLALLVGEPCNWLYTLPVHNRLHVTEIILSWLAL